MIFIVITIWVLGSFVIYIFFPHIIKIWLREKFLLNMAKSEYIYLTFDDGPNPESTPRILELLDESGVKATFFLIGENIEKYPYLVEEIKERGHEIGEHGYSHAHPWKIGPISTTIDLIKNSKTTERYINPGNQILFRPPFGKFNTVSVLYLWFTKRKAVFWNVDPKDYKLKRA